MTARSVPARGSRRRRAALLTVLLGIAAAGAATTPFGRPATALVVVLAAVAMVRAVTLPSHPVPTDRRLGSGLMLWSALIAVLLAWELFSLLRQPEWNRPDPSAPTLSTLLDPALEHGPWRLVGWLLWLVVGWRLLR
ncbi:hypothetical protein [Nocardia paucivorans]|uniref:hypothetical protein n=1 Tax=Nocardia paucivorans TaxID=114259 RepID=UPI000309AC15|nr:hypothetical protein [Nocardia paucivorans]